MSALLFQCSKAEGLLPAQFPPVRNASDSRHFGESSKHFTRSHWRSWVPQNPKQSFFSLFMKCCIYLVYRIEASLSGMANIERMNMQADQPLNSAPNWRIALLIDADNVSHTKAR